MHFKARAHDKLNDEVLQGNLVKIKGKFVAKRRESILELDDFEGTRDAGKAIRQRALDNLDVWLEIFEASATARGATVLWAQTPADVNALVLDIAARHGVGKIIKSKSMVSEESALDHAIEAAGLTVVETDLGEYILQINDYEPPSHIIGPALHKSKEEVADLFHKAHGTPRKTGIEELCLEARGVLRGHYLTADMGISGGNFLVAETGSVVLVTNEGNATLATTLPKVHVAISGIEKIVPTLEDVATLMRLLGRSSTGQSISANVVSVRRLASRSACDCSLVRSGLSRLAAAADAVREELKLVLSPAETGDHDRLLAAVRERLAHAAFEAAWAEGRALGLDRAVAYALSG